MATLSTLINTEQQVNPQTNAHNQRALPSVYISDNVRSFPSISFLPFLLFASHFSPPQPAAGLSGSLADVHPQTPSPVQRQVHPRTPAPPAGLVRTGKLLGGEGGGKFSKNPPTQIPSPVAFARGEMLRVLQRGYWEWIRQRCGQHLHSCLVVTWGEKLPPSFSPIFGQSQPLPSTLPGCGGNLGDEGPCRESVTRLDGAGAWSRALLAGIRAPVIAGTS